MPPTRHSEPPRPRAKRQRVATDVPVEALAVGLQRERANMFTIATVYKNLDKMFDEIYCFCDDSVRRDYNECGCV